MSHNNFDSKKVCRTCGTPLEIRQTRPSPTRAQKAYYYTAYYVCPNCQKMYHDERFKVTNKQTASLFESKSPSLLRPHPDPLPACRQARLRGEGIGKTYDVQIWTDGACSHNGRPEAKASWAFVSGPHEEAGRVVGKQTNNMGEGTAVLKALEWAAAQGHKVIRLHTDSQITIQNLQKAPDKVKVNRELFEEIEKVIRDNDLLVEYVKVPGHADDVNNNRADRLANGLVGIK